MLIDYKNYREAPQDGRSRARRLLRSLVLVVAVALLGVGGYAYRSHRVLARARALAHDGHVDEARVALEGISGAWVGAGRALSGLAVLEAQAGRPEAARSRMADAARHERHTSPLRADDALRACFARGDYELARDVATFLWQAGRTDEVDFYLGAAQLALGQLDEAQGALARVDPISEQGDRANQMKERIRSLEADPRVAVVMDRQRRPLALAKAGAADGSLELLQTTLSDLLVGQGGFVTDMPPAARRQIHILTIDEDLQLIADQALGTNDGFLIALDPTTGEVLAHVTRGIAARSFGWEGTELPGRFEPGSIIKVATFLTAQEEGLGALESVFPFECGGTMIVEGKAFSDWTRHGTVPDIDHALAVSCNLAFAKLGLLAGPERVTRTLERLGFGHAAVGPFALGSLHAGQGERALANMSIGLEELAGTPMQVALMAQAVAAGGIVRRPILVREVLDVLYERVGGESPQLLGADEAASRVATPEQIARLTTAMKAVVDLPVGTARRAHIEGLALAAKTGTAGDRGKGLDAILVAFAPADAPRIAVGLMASRAGKAEYEGARVLKAFFDGAIARGKIPGIEAAPLEGTASAATGKE